MNIRLAGSVIVVGALAYACGPQSRSELSHETGLVAQQGVVLASIAGGVRVPQTVEKTEKSRSTSLATKFDVALEGDDVRFQLSIVNKTTKSVEVSFASGQSYDFVVVDSVGREVWRWAEGRIFTQSVQNKLLGKGDTLTVSEKWSPAKPGKFTAIAMLKSRNFPIEEKVEFERK